MAKKYHPEVKTIKENENIKTMKMESSANLPSPLGAVESTGLATETYCRPLSMVGSRILGFKNCILNFKISIFNLVTRKTRLSARLFEIEKGRTI
ncbi:hypothetical protein M9H77_02261 [Catharanthus roseus]|uniref:Uncharacterized protein n=1 Tax=Catharanthus roseus TaxID=4058 RepID=A0ACC0C7V5_CATRO|nr:hypothetical protein M9H77_02261 [Catharanthus roseus]